MGLEMGFMVLQLSGGEGIFAVDVVVNLVLWFLFIEDLIILLF